MPSTQDLTGTQVSFAHRLSCSNEIPGFGDEEFVTQIVTIEPYACVEDILSEDYHLYSGLVQAQVNDEDTGTWLYILTPNDSACGFAHWYVDVNATEFGEFQAEGTQ